jgi:hypothetical protein
LERVGFIFQVPNTSWAEHGVLNKIIRGMSVMVRMSQRCGSLEARNKSKRVEGGFHTLARA